jgi:hypothetical protein
MYCFNDKRFVVERALSSFRTAIYLDADIKIMADIPKNLDFLPGICGYYQNLLYHVSKYRPQDLESIKKVASKLAISLNDAKWIREDLFIVTKDGEKEEEFLKMWGLIARYLELKGMHSGEGSVMGLAAAKVGWKVEKGESWKSLNQIKNFQHIDTSSKSKHRTFWENLRFRILYHYRVNKARLLALKDFDFFYH